MRPWKCVGGEVRRPHLAVTRCNIRERGDPQPATENECVWLGLAPCIIKNQIC